jgi:hypothetical protein
VAGGSGRRVPPIAAPPEGRRQPGRHRCLCKPRGPERSRAGSGRSPLA